MFTLAVGWVRMPKPKTLLVHEPLSKPNLAPRTPPHPVFPPSVPPYCPPFPYFRAAFPRLSAFAQQSRIPNDFPSIACCSSLNVFANESLLPGVGKVQVIMDPCWGNVCPAHARCMPGTLPL